MKTQSMDSLLNELRAVSEPTRLRLLILLHQSELSVKDLTTILGQSQPRISRHLKLLVDAGLIQRSQEGAWAYYRLAGHKSNLIHTLLQYANPNDPILIADRERLQSVKRTNAESAGRYFAANAAAWDTIRSLHISQTEVETAIRKIIGEYPIQSFLDLGTGTGRLLELFQGLYIIALGIDSSRDMLSVARANLDRAQIHHARVAHGDLNILDIPNNTYDLIAFHQVLHYLDDPAHAIREAARRLAPGGRLLIVDFAPHDLEFLRQKHAHRRLGISHDQIDRWLAEAGLDRIEIRDLTAEPEKLTSLTVTIWLARDKRIIADPPLVATALETA